MSNGPFVYTLEDQAAHFAQFSKAMELAREKLVHPGKVTDALQAILGDEEIVRVPKVVTTPTGRIFHVTGSFNSAAEALDAGNYDLKWGLAKKPADIPLIIQPADCMVRAVPLGRVIKIGELFQLYPRIVDPMTLLIFGAKFPEEQRQTPHLTVWKDTLGQFWCALLLVLGRRRIVDVSRVRPVDYWRERGRVLVREFPSA